MTAYAEDLAIRDDKMTAAQRAGYEWIVDNDIEDYFGTGLVTQVLNERGKTLTPHVAIQTAASSGAHLTKYSNITDIQTGQKKLIVDDAIVPSRAAFQYDVTTSMSPGFTADGALDGISHMIEVLYGAVGQSFYGKAEEVAGTGVNLIVTHLERAVGDPADLEHRVRPGADPEPCQTGQRPPANAPGPGRWSPGC